MIRVLVGRKINTIVHDSNEWVLRVVDVYTCAIRSMLISLLSMAVFVQFSRKWVIR